MLREWVNGIFHKTSYDRFELIVVDNDSSEQSTLDLYKEITAKSAHVVQFNEPFNYSRACNKGAAVAKGELLLFLNNDIEVIDPNWLSHLVQAASRPGVGIVGPQLLYPDGEIQHAGVAIGLFTLAAHVFHRASNEWGPLGSPTTPRNTMAVTGACQLMPRRVFDLVGGYDETFVIAYSDVAICLDAAQFGFRTVYAPQSKLVHHEGKTRGFENPSYDQSIFAKRLRAQGIVCDPFFHSRLKTNVFIPTLSESDGGKSGPTQLQIDVGTLAGESSPLSPLDIFDDSLIAAAIDRECHRITTLLEAGSAPTADSMAEAIIMVLRRRADLRQRFPRALSDGPNGDFAHWFRGPGLECLGLSPDCASLVDAVFAANLDAPARHILLYDESLRGQEPLFLLPSGRSSACRTLFQAFDEGRLKRVNVWWFLLKAAEDPIRELNATWSILPEWQAAVPAGGSVFGTMILRRWVATTFGIEQDWLFEQSIPPLQSPAAHVRLAYEATPAWQKAFPHALVRADEAARMLTCLSTDPEVSFLARDWLKTRDIKALASEVVRPGVNLLGHFSYPSGLRISAESICTSLHVENIATSLRDVPVGLQFDEPTATALHGCEIYDVTILHVQPTPFFDQVYERAGLLPQPRQSYRIGFWYWELDEIPSEWDRLALDCDELWTATTFVAEGLRKRYRQPVNVFLPGVELPKFDILPRSHFQLANDSFVFLFIFHMRSIMERKNPLAIIDAFASAFGPSDNAELIIKTMSGDAVPKDFALLAAAAAGKKNVRIVNEVYTRDETLCLIHCCDAYVSLHRSEGLGLTMAEAMLLGRPVVATRYSGNLDFMDDENSLLVDFTLTTIDQAIPPYKAGQRWASPSIAQAAAHMRRLYDDPVAARALGARAKADLESRLSYKSAGQRMKARLQAIEGEPL